jgi:hypothetical protein
LTGAPRPRPARRPPRRRLLRKLIPLVVAALLFAVGVALGQALDDNPRPGGTQTIVRTLVPPSTLGPPPRTVTVTGEG